MYRRASPRKDNLRRALAQEAARIMAQHGIHECGLSMINMGDNGDIAYRLAHKFNFPSLVPS